MKPYAETLDKYEPSKKNKIGRNLESKITFDGIVYNTSLFYTPVPKDSKEYKYLVSKMSSRKQFDKAKNKLVTCLGITAGNVKYILDESIVSLYLFVNEKGKATSDQASGTLQVVNNNSSIDTTELSQAWICDLCRHAPDKTKKSAKSPVAPIMHLFEQIAYYVFKKSEIYLMVEKEEPFLVGFYRDNYGFAVDDAFTVMNDNKKSHIVMKKTIAPDPVFADFPFAELLKKRTRTKKAHSSLNSTKGGTFIRRQRKTRRL